jgi:hypothetical protein
MVAMLALSFFIKLEIKQPFKKYAKGIESLQKKTNFLTRIPLQPDGINL